jgi:Transglutaminase-like superfamily
MSRFGLFSTYSRTAAFTAVFLFLLQLASAFAGPLIKGPPVGERWFGILVDDEQVGFYHQRISALPDGGGYRIETDGRVRMKVMGFSRESSSREIYLVSPGLALKSFVVDQTLDGVSSKLTGRTIEGGLRVRRETGGKQTERVFKAKGEIIPGPALNMIPLMRDLTPGKVHRILSFDPEDFKVKDLKITVVGEQRQPDGRMATKLSTNLYAFVNTEITVDAEGNTLLESVRDGLVTTKAETPERLATYVSGVAMSQKDLIYDFSMVRATPPVKQAVSKLRGLVVEIEDYPAQLPLLADGWQQAERKESSVIIRTAAANNRAVLPEADLSGYLKAVEGIESDAPEILEKARELSAGRKGQMEIAQAVAGWTATWIEDAIDDGGGARASIKSRRGNCQTHAKLYAAVARAAGIPTRFVSGLVSRNGSSFIYHSWTESWLDGKWVAVDPTFGQLPADPTHLAFFEGHTPAELSPILGMIGKIRLKVLEEL